jgi:asparagine synthase (glutamine-hydrolysing)
MCGIAGFYNKRVDRTQIDALLGMLKHRGPDAQNFMVHNDVGLLHTRLSILDLTELGSQPYCFENLILTYNGEIYNYNEVRDDLIILGYTFVSQSDTEVLIKAFHCWGERCVDHFIGMFAFAIYDKNSDELLLCRDRLGVKPLYYSFINGAFSFSSELKAFQIFNVPKELNLDAVAKYFRFGYVPADKSVFTSVSKLESGHFLKVNRKGIHVQRYWDLHEEPVQGRSEDDWLDELEQLLISAFRYRMVSDVPVGVFLSGGIDSSILAAILQKHVGNIHSFTIGFNEQKFDESEFAKQVAAKLNISHTEKSLNLDEARSLLLDFYSIYDEPFADTSGIPVASVTQLAKQSGMKVVLSADGGDELFGGYTHYQKAYSLLQKFSTIPQGLRKSLVGSSRFFIPSSLRTKIKAYNFHHRLSALEELLLSDDAASFFEAYIANQSLDEVSEIMDGREVKREGSNFSKKHPMAEMMEWDLKSYLPDDLLVKVDRATMYYGIECREPFLDHRLVEFAARVPIEFKFRGGEQKYLLKRLLRRYLPTEYFQRKKQGFSIPVFEWFIRDLDKMFHDYLSTENLKKVPFLNASAIQLECRKYEYYKKLGKSYNIEKMWRLLSFMMWYKKWM